MAALCGLCAALACIAPAHSQNITTFYGQDQDWFTTAPSTLTGQITNASGWTVDSFTITADNGSPVSVTVTNQGNGIFLGSIPWTNTAGNPSEHTVYAQATIHITHYNQTQTMTLDSRVAPGGPGRAADFIVANLQLQSLQYQADSGTNLTLMQDASTPVPVPQVTFTQANPPTAATTNPAGYIMGSKPSYLYTLPNITGAAQMGLTMTATATPFPGSDSALTLKTTGSTPIPFTGSTMIGSTFTVNSDTALYNKVYRYNMILGNLGLWVQFTQTGQTPGPWREVTTYGSGSTTLSTFFYGILAEPTLPMKKPWLGVLDYACVWAAGTADATSATTALTTGFYNNAMYNPGSDTYDTINPDPSTRQQYPEIFQLKRFLSTSPLGSSNGAGCNAFAHFMVCLSNAIGAVPLNSQRENAAFYSLPTTWANDQIASDKHTHGYAYHMFSTDGFFANTNGNIYDATQKIGGTTFISNINGPLIGSSYYNQVVGIPLPLPGSKDYDWNTSLWDPFIPMISN